MKELSLRYSWDDFGHSIDVIELWNSLIWFWWYLQLIAKEQNIDNLQINVKATEQWSFVVILDLIAQNAWLFWSALDVLWSLLDIAKTIIELKKHLRWNPPAHANVTGDGNVAVQNCDWATINISANTYNFYTTNNIAINRTLWWFTSPLNKIGNLTKIEIDSNNENMGISINEDEWLFFDADNLQKSTENNVLVEGIMKSMSMNTYTWQIEMYRKNYKVNFKGIRTLDEAIHKLWYSMTHWTKIFIKWNITYQWDDIAQIDIVGVIEEQNLLKNEELSK